MHEAKFQYLEWKVAAVGFVLQCHIFPLDGEDCSVVHVLDGRLVAHAGIEVGHQWSNVLRRGQPRVDVVAGVEESASCYRDIAYQVAVEGEIKWQRNRK